MDLRRRDFLKLTAASAAAVKVGDSGNQLGNVLEATAHEERAPDGVEKFATAVCDRCPGGCGARVRLIDTRAVKVEGNPLHPVSGGGLCPVGQASLQALYSPDRVHSPLKRIGARGAGHWRAIAWDAAILEMAGRLRGLRAAGRPEALAIMLGRSDGAVPDLFRRFATVFGTPNVLEASRPDASDLALWATQGVRRPAAYDLENAKYVLSFGVPLLEGWWSPVRQMRALAQIRQGTPGRRGKLVHFDPRLSPTGARADEWLPIVPGTEGALALGIASVLVAEGRYDRRFVDERTFGFDDWSDESGNHAGFRSLLLKEYSPAAVAAITGVPAETIRRIALEFATFGPGLAIGPAGAGATLEAAVAVHALNALVGSIERPGGVLIAPDSPVAPFPDPALDAVAQRGLASRPLATAHAYPGAATFADLPHGTGGARPAALLVWGADPVFAGPDPQAMRHAVETIPFVVSFSAFLDDTAALADLVLPDHVFPEGWQELASSPALPRQVIGIAQPAVTALHDTRQSGDVVLQLARALGGGIAAAFPWAEHKDVLAARGAGLHAAAGAAFGATAAATGTASAAPESAASATFDDFWSDVAAKGGWAGPAYRYGDWARVLRTPSARFEFYSRTLRDAVRGAARPAELLAGLGLGAQDDRLYLPHWAPRQELGDPATFPLRLHTFTTLALGDGSGANEPFLQELIAPHVNVSWDSWAELNPATAARLGIADGALIWVESPVGRVRVQARLYQGVMPDVVAVAVGQGHQQLGRYARGRGANAAVLIPATRQPLGGGPLHQPRVKVYAA